MVMDETKEAREFLANELKGRYEVGSFKGKGGAGITFVMKYSSTNIRRVAKVLRPSVAKSKRLLRVKKGFISEGRKLSVVHHPNLPVIYDFYDNAKYPFYIMDYISGCRMDNAARQLAKKMTKGAWVTHLFEYSKQLFSVLNYLHNCKPRSLLHLDIKPDNYLLNLHRGNAYLIDFGIARYWKGTSTTDRPTAISGTFPLWPTKYHRYLKRLTDENRSLFFINRNLLKQSLDLHLAARTISIAIRAGLTVDGVVHTWDFQVLEKYNLINSITDILDIDKSEMELSYTAGDVCKWFEEGKTHDKRASNLFDYGLIKVPGTFIDTFGKSVSPIIDSKAFQRLRGIKQLGFTYLVYPGAKHDRHEHSLGVFHNALCYLDQLSSQNVDFKFRSSMSDEYLVATALSALLHDVGHSPFGHQMMIKGEYDDHEKRGLLMVKNDASIRRAIVQSFNKDVYQCCIELMEYIYNSDHKKMLTKTPEPVYHVLKAILSSAIDVDKLDYIMRDSLHSGVPYGSIVDRERLISSLRVWYSTERDPTLVISDKGRASAEAIVFARYILTSEVYWNHAVRAFAAMLTATLKDLDPDLIKEELNSTDEEFLLWLRSKPETKWFFSHFDIRKPYKRAFVVQRGGGSRENEESTSQIFNRLERALSNPADYSAVSDAVKAALDLGRNFNPHDIVLDIPSGMTKITGIQVLPEGHDRPGLISPIYSSIANHFDNVARKARIFIRPDLLGSKNLIESNNLIRKALCEKYGISP